MPARNKIKGSNFEREIVNLAAAKGMTAKRAYASNGRALGEAEAVDCVIEGYRIQCKRRKKLASFLQIPEGCDVVSFRQDNGESLILMPIDMFLSFIKQPE